MNRLTLATAVAALVLCESAVAQMLTIEWDAAGRFSKEVAVPAGKFVEACEKLPKGARVDWSFEAPAPLDFNVHYHVGEKVEYPARKRQVARDAGTLAAALDQDYCWMWTNRGAAETTLRLKLAKR